MKKMDFELFRSSIIWEKFKKIIEQKEENISKIVKKLKISKENLVNILDWKGLWNDDFFEKLWKNIWLDEIQINKIFMEADREEYKYRYWKDIDSFETAFSKEFWKELTDEDIELLDRLFRNN